MTRLVCMVELTILSSISLLSIVPIIQFIAGLLTILVVVRQIVVGVSKDGSFIKWLKSKK